MPWSIWRAIASNIRRHGWKDLSWRPFSSFMRANSSCLLALVSASINSATRHACCVTSGIFYIRSRLGAHAHALFYLGTIFLRRGSRRGIFCFADAFAAAAGVALAARI